MAKKDMAKRVSGQQSLIADRFEKVLAMGALVLLATVLVALAKGHADWSKVPAAVWAHLVTILIAVGMTPIMLLRPRGDRLHRRLGYVWVIAMGLTALITFSIRTSNNGHFSFIHILSVWTLIQVPIIVLAARAHNIRRHRSAVRAMVFGALLIAGFFTFPFDRMLGHWLFS